MIKRNNINNTQLSPIISNTDNTAKKIIDKLIPANKFTKSILP